MWNTIVEIWVNIRVYAHFLPIWAGFAIPWAIGYILFIFINKPSVAMLRTLIYIAVMLFGVLISRCYLCYEDRLMAIPLGVFYLYTLWVKAMTP